VIVGFPFAAPTALNKNSLQLTSSALLRESRGRRGRDSEPARGGFRRRNFGPGDSPEPAAIDNDRPRIIAILIVPERASEALGPRRGARMSAQDDLGSRTEIKIIAAFESMPVALLR
jgi:hypothetical protein